MGRILLFYFKISMKISGPIYGGSLGKTYVFKDLSPPFPPYSVASVASHTY